MTSYNGDMLTVEPAEARFVEFIATHGRPIAINPANVCYVEGRTIRNPDGSRAAEGSEVYMDNRSVTVQGRLDWVLRRLRGGPDELPMEGEGR